MERPAAIAERPWGVLGAYGGQNRAAAAALFLASKTGAAEELLLWAVVDE